MGNELRGLRAAVAEERDLPPRSVGAADHARRGPGRAIGLTSLASQDPTAHFFGFLGFSGLLCGTVTVAWTAALLPAASVPVRTSV